MIRIYLVILSGLLFTQCNFIDSSDAVPMILEINPADLATNFSQGANTHDIRDVWVYVDGFSIGVYELPARVPILSNNTQVEVNIFAGIRNNGTVANVIEYPFYEKLDFSYEFVPEKVVTIDPVFEYRDDAVFTIVEDFESGHIFSFDLDDNPGTFIDLDQSDAATGNSSGIMRLDSANNELEVTTFDYIDIDIVQNGNIFLEMDYKNDVEFQIGLLTVIGTLEFSEYAIILRQSEEWNKIYINLGSGLGGGVELFRLLIGSINQTGQERVVNLDNIKLIHF